MTPFNTLAEAAQWIIEQNYPECSVKVYLRGRMMPSKMECFEVLRQVDQGRNI
jgi:hypothetical protein